MQKSYKINTEYRYLYLKTLAKRYKPLSQVIDNFKHGLGYVDKDMADFGDYVKTATVLSKLIRVMYTDDT